MADLHNTERDDELAKIRVFDKMWDLLDRIRNDEEIQVHMGVDLAQEIDQVLDQARQVRF